MATTGRRSYRVVQAADGHMRADFMQTLQTCFQQKIDSLPQSAHLRSTRVLIFRLLARAGACAEQVLFAERKGFPYKLFTALIKPIAKFKDDEPCMFDRMSLSIVKAFPDLQKPEPQAFLHAAAALVWTDISAVEATHASTRRITTVKSVQTNTVSFEETNSEHLSRQIANLRRDFQVHAGDVLQQTSRQRKRCRAPTKRKRSLTAKQKGFRRGGGAHRAYLSIHGRGKDCRSRSATSFKALSAAYKQMKEENPEALAYYADVGKAGTQAARAGFKAFGDRGKSRPKRELQRISGVQLLNLKSELRAVKDQCRQDLIEEQKQLEEQCSALVENKRGILHSQLQELLPDLPCDVVSNALAGAGVCCVQFQAATDLLTQARSQTLPQ